VSSTAQLPLPLRFPAEQRLEHFAPADAAEPSLLRAAIAERQRVLICGPSDCGKTHLLLASAAAADAQGLSVAYWSLATLGEQAAAALQAQPGIDLLAIDDLDLAAGRADLELALFGLHNRQTDAGGTVFYAARHGPDALRLDLPDLRSRLSQCLRLTPAPLDESQRRALLMARAERRGLSLDEAALDYLFRRVGRDLRGLLALFDRIDHASLVAQRRISVPFLRQLLAQDGAALS